MSPKNRIYILVIFLFCSLLYPYINARPNPEAGRTVLNIQVKADSLGVDSLVSGWQADAEKQKKTPSQAPVPYKVADSTTYNSQPNLKAGRTTPDIQLKADSSGVDSLQADSAKQKKAALQAPIQYKAVDSIVFLENGMAYMYNKGVVTYEDIQLDADRIQMSLDSSQVYAFGNPDSVGTAAGIPVFKDNSGEYTSSTLLYNFKTKQGFITNIITTQGEGYLTGGKTKKMAGDEFYMQDGKYTTCDLHDHPHFYLQLTKAKVIPKKNIVTGPAYLVLADVPLPLAIPFGFFPFTDKYSSGIIMPTFGDESARGFYLRDGGYYFAFSDYVDMALTGEIYTKGSWGLNAQSNYVMRYKFSGSFNMGYLVTVTGDKGLPDYEEQTNFRLTWNHQQDAKANPNMTFSASVNFTTSGYSRNDLNSYYNPNSFTENTKSSTVNMSYRFPNSPFSISTSANIAQRTKDSTLSVSLPDLTLSMSRIYPFKRKVMIGKEKWYEKIYMNYTGMFRNSIDTKQDLFFKSSLIKDWRNGMQHNVPVGATFSMLKYINISPSVTFTDRMYTNKIMRQWDPLSAAEVQDTIYGFYNVYNFNASVSAQTKLYGMYRPLPFLGDKIKVIRHVFTPSITYSVMPDFGNPNFGFWKSYNYTDTNGNRVTRDYSPFSSGIFGTAPRGKQSLVTFSVANNLEMKVRSDRDSVGGERKISLIENLSGNMSYNAAADSMNWSNLNTSILIKLTKGFNLQLTAVFDTYTYRLNASGNPVRVNVPRWKAGKGIGRLSSTGTSFSYTFNNDTFKKKKKDNPLDKSTNPDETDEENPDEPNNPPRNNSLTSKTSQNKDDEFDSDGYLIWQVPWSLSINYSTNLAYGTFNKKKLEYNYKITQNLSFSGTISPTKGWSFSMSTSYDFDQKKIAYMSCSVTRDLHCWSMGADFIPVGPFKSYNFNIAVKSSLLSDLKYNKRSPAYERVNWY